MICEECGTQNGIDARFCSQCGASLSAEEAAQEPPINESGWGRVIGIWVVGGICLLYLANPTAGFFELIPDNLPIIGNLDELTASAGLLWALRTLGLRLPGS